MTAQQGTRAEGRAVTAATLRRIPLFREAPENALASLAAVSRRQVLGHDDTLWEPDDALDAVVALAAGVVRLYRHLDSGEEVTVALLDRGQICGLADLDAAFVPTTVAQALMNETVVYRTPRRHFADFLLANPTVALRALAEADRRVEDAYDLCALPDTRARVAYVLAHLVRDSGERTVWATHEDLAAWAHARRQALTGEVLPDLRGRGLIGYERRRRGIRVLDRAGLLALASGDNAHVR